MTKLFVNERNESYRQRHFKVNRFVQTVAFCRGEKLPVFFFLDLLRVYMLISEVNKWGRDVFAEGGSLNTGFCVSRMIYLWYIPASQLRLIRSTNNAWEWWTCYCFSQTACYIKTVFELAAFIQIKLFVVHNTFFTKGKKSVFLISYTFIFFIKGYQWNGWFMLLRSRNCLVLLRHPELCNNSQNRVLSFITNGRILLQLMNFCSDVLKKVYSESDFLCCSAPISPSRLYYL